MAIQFKVKIEEWHLSDPWAYDHRLRIIVGTGFGKSPKAAAKVAQANVDRKVKSLPKDTEWFCNLHAFELFDLAGNEIHYDGLYTGGRR